MTTTVVSWQTLPVTTVSMIATSRSLVVDGLALQVFVQQSASSITSIISSTRAEHMDPTMRPQNPGQNNNNDNDGNNMGNDSNDNKDKNQNDGHKGLSDGSEDVLIAFGSIGMLRLKC